MKMHKFRRYLFIINKNFHFTLPTASYASKVLYKVSSKFIEFSSTAWNLNKKR